MMDLVVREMPYCEGKPTVKENKFRVIALQNSPGFLLPA